MTLVLVGHGPAPAEPGAARYEAQPHARRSVARSITSAEAGVTKEEKRSDSGSTGRGRPWPLVAIAFLSALVLTAPADRQRRPTVVGHGARQIVVGGRTRTYLLARPTSEAGRSLPVIVALQGGR